MRTTRLVGLVAYAFNPDDGRYWNIRLMIDAQHQGKGYGTAAMRVVLDRLRSAPDCQQIALDYAAKNAAARHVYPMFGSRETEQTGHGTIIATLDTVNG